MHNIKKIHLTEKVFLTALATIDRSNKLTYLGGLIAAPQTPARIFTNKNDDLIQHRFLWLNLLAVQAGKPMIATRIGTGHRC